MNMFVLSDFARYKMHKREQIVTKKVTDDSDITVLIMIVILTQNDHEYGRIKRFMDYN